MSRIAENFIKSTNKGKILEKWWDKTLIQRAIQFALIAHKDQFRKGDGAPYIIHPIEVGIILGRFNPIDSIIAAGILHDTIEDADATHKDLARRFGFIVADIVRDVTEGDKTLPWRERKEIALEHARKMPARSLMVKMADKIHNLRSMYNAYLQQGPDLLKKFNASLKEQMDMDRKLFQVIETRLKDNLPLSSKINDLSMQLKNTMDDIAGMKKDYEMLLDGKIDTTKSLLDNCRG